MLRVWKAINLIESAKYRAEDLRRRDVAARLSEAERELAAALGVATARSRNVPSRILRKSAMIC